MFWNRLEETESEWASLTGLWPSMNNKFNIKYYAKEKISLLGLDRRNNRNKQSSLLWSVKHSLFVVLVQAVILDNINDIVYLLKKKKNWNSVSDAHLQCL